jgi:hypothetical protein
MKRHHRDKDVEALVKLVEAEEAAEAERMLEEAQRREDAKLAAKHAERSSG